MLRLIKTVKAISIIENYCAENEIFLEEKLTPKTKLIEELGLNSIDIVAIVKSAEEVYQKKKNLIELLMPTEGNYRDDIDPKTIEEFFTGKNNTETGKKKRYSRELPTYEEFMTTQKAVRIDQWNDTELEIDYEIIFILSSPRSGSTLLQNILCQNYEIKGSEELHLLAYDTYKRREKSLSDEKLKHLLDGTGIVRSEITGMRDDIAKQVDKMYTKDNRPTTTFYQEINKYMKGKALIDKTPSYGYSLEVLRRMNKLFPRAKYIHLKRDPRGCIKSMLDAKLQRIIPFTQGLRIEESKIPEILWQMCETNIKAFKNESNHQQWLNLTYEDLLNNTREELERISKFIGKTVSLEDNEDNTKTGRFNKHFAGDMKYLLQKGIQPSRGNAWKEFEELTKVSNYTIKLMGG